MTDRQRRRSPEPTTNANQQQSHEGHQPSCDFVLHPFLFCPVGSAWPIALEVDQILGQGGVALELVTVVEEENNRSTRVGDRCSLHSVWEGSDAHLDVLAATDCPSRILSWPP